MAADKDPAPAVSRALHIMRLLERSSGLPLTLSDLSRGIDAAKSSTSNVCAVLEEGGMIRRVEGGYRLGRRTAELGGAFAGQFNQIREFYAIIERDPLLRHHVVQIAMLDDIAALYLARYEGRMHRVGTPLGSRLFAVTTGAGLAMLSRLADDQVDDIISRTPEAALRTGTGVPLDAAAAEGPLIGADSTARTRIWEQVRDARTTGYSVDRGGSYQGICGVAVPLEPWRPSDPPLGMGVALPIDEASDEQIDRVGRSIRDIARQLTNPFVRSTSA